MSLNLKEQAKKLNSKLRVVFLAYKRKDTPILAKVIAVITIGYALSPIDLVPDFIPVLGYLDDIIILPVLIVLCIKLIPSKIMVECESQAEDLWKDGKPKKWFYAIPIIVIWVLIVGIIINKIFF